MYIFIEFSIDYDSSGSEINDNVVPKQEATIEKKEIKMKKKVKKKSTSKLSLSKPQIDEDVGDGVVLGSPKVKPIQASIKTKSFKKKGKRTIKSSSIDNTNIECVTKEINQEASHKQKNEIDLKLSKSVSKRLPSRVG